MILRFAKNAEKKPDSQVPSMIPSLDSVKSTGLNQGEGGPCHAQARETIIWISLAAALRGRLESCASFWTQNDRSIHNDPYEI